MKDADILVDLDEGFISNFVIKKSSSVALKMLAKKCKKDFAIFMSYAKAAGFEKLLLDVIRQFFKIKASRLELIANYDVSNINLKVESIDEGMMDSIKELFDPITKHFNLFRVYLKIKALDKQSGFVENNKKLVVSSLIWLLCINGNLIKYFNTLKKSFMES